MSRQVIEQVSHFFFFFFNETVFVFFLSLANCGRVNAAFGAELWRFGTSVSAGVGGQRDERSRGTAGRQAWTVDQSWFGRAAGRVTAMGAGVQVIKSHTEMRGRLISPRSQSWSVNPTSAPASCPGTRCSSGTAARLWPAFCIPAPPSCPALPHFRWWLWSLRWD